MKKSPTIASLLRLERTLAEIYTRLDAVEEDTAQHHVFTELRHNKECSINILHRGSTVASGVDFTRVTLYCRLFRLLGSTFVLRQISSCENRVERTAESLNVPSEIAENSRRNREIIGSLAAREPMSYMGSVVLGLNDALVEFTGALAGFTLALGESRLVALAGGITGIAAAMSMAASEYLSTRSERPCEKCPIKAAAHTGVTYALTVMVLLVPYFIFSRTGIALSLMLCMALAIIALFNWYYAVVRCESFCRRFLEMTVVSLGIAAISFVIGYMLKLFTGIDF